MKTFLTLVLGVCALLTLAQEKEKFTIVKEIPHLPVISQGSTGTCWSFATTSFLESEIIRKGFPEMDLSEMFFVYYGYQNKAKQYWLYHGNNNFDQGGQAHDVLKVLKEKGLAAFDDFPGIKTDGRYRHTELVQTLKAKVEEINVEEKNFRANNTSKLNDILKEYLGNPPRKTQTPFGDMTPVDFAGKLSINADDYIEFSSYAHHPFYKPFVLEVPDNWAHELYYNLPVDELIEVIDNALNNGYTVCWDGDTSEKTFTHKKGKADVPKKLVGKVDQGLRQETFFDRATTDDHLMHIVGISEDTSGRKYYYTKNSWGAESNEFGGYLHMSEDYVRLKTIAIMLHRDAIPGQIRQKLNL